MAVHDVSRELRGEHGRWTKGGQVLHRLAKEATAGSSSTGDHEQVHNSVRAVARGTGKTIGGHRIDRTQKDKYRVGLKTSTGRDTKLYNTPEDAAKAISEGKHHDSGTESAFRKVTSKGPDIPKGVPSEDELKGKTPEQLQEMANIARGQGDYPGKNLTLARIRSEQIRRQRESAPRPKQERTPREQKPNVTAAALAAVKARQARGTTTKNYAPMTPELQAQMRRIQAEQKAKTEAENKATNRGGVTENRGAGVGTGKPSLAGGATPGTGLAHLSDSSLQRMVERRGYNWKGAERELAARREKVQAASRPAAGSLADHIHQLDIRLQEMHQETGAPLYTAKQIVETRIDQVVEGLRAGDQRITLKVPSGSEITIPREVAIELAPADIRRRYQRAGWKAG